VIHRISVKNTAVIVVVDAFIGPKFVMITMLALRILVPLKHLNVFLLLLNVMIMMPALLKYVMKILDIVHTLLSPVTITMPVLMTAVIHHLDVFITQ
jgi:hypothetical protein